MTAEQRRRFNRVQFHEGASLLLADRRFACEVRDLSLKGALLACPGASSARRGDSCELILALDGGEVVAMKGEIAHVATTADNVQVGLVCREIDIDSITHLRRLVALNLGDEQVLERELAALIRE
ncbi:MAG: PilZ domain-containing protein [Zoogloea sp.]|nr:PilZ domain-containing protein [Zoogloea sp.]